jgi:F5/8 type C domain
MKPRFHRFNFLLGILITLISFQTQSQTLITPFSATASHSYSGFPPSNAIDGNTNSFWSAGVTDIVLPYIEIDLGPNGDTKIAKVELVVAQSPAGLTTHSISGRTSSGTTVSFGQVTSYTDHQQLISVPVSSNIAVRYIRVQTSLSPSWPAWAEIRAYKPAAQNLIGQLSASPNECDIPPFNQSCTVQLSWNISPANSAFTLWIENSPLYGTTWITQTGTTIGIPFIREGANQFVLRAGSADPNGAVIARATVIGRQAAVVPIANLSASPATCQISPQAQTCGSQLTWTVNPTNTPVSLWQHKFDS